MQSILDAINEWIKEILIGAINGNLSTMFGDVNEKVGTIAAEVGQTPQGWNANIFSMIQTLSENVIVPIAGLVIAMYEKHGQPLEVVVKNIIRTKFIAPKERPYRTDNFYSVLERQRKLEKEVSAIAKGNTKKQRGGKRKA